MGGGCEAYPRSLRCPGRACLWGVGHTVWPCLTRSLPGPAGHVVAAPEAIPGQGQRPQACALHRLPRKRGPRQQPSACFLPNPQTAPESRSSQLWQADKWSLAFASAGGAPRARALWNALRALGVPCAGGRPESPASTPLPATTAFCLGSPAVERPRGPVGVGCPPPSDWQSGQGESAVPPTLPLELCGSGLDFCCLQPRAEMGAPGH